MPHHYLAGDGPEARPNGGWKGTFTSSDRMITATYDEGEYDFHVDAKEGYDPAVMRDVLAGLRRLGLEILDDDEMEPEILEDGTIRRYLAPVPAEHCTLRLVAA